MSKTAPADPWYPWLDAFTAVCRDLVDAVADKRNHAGTIAPYVHNIERLAACQPQLPEHMTRIGWPMPVGAPTTPPDDEALRVPRPPEHLPAECPPGFRIPEKHDA